MRFSSDTSISTSSLLTVPSSCAYVKHGIGGAGNFHKASKSSPAPAHPAYKRVSGSFISGVGGFGNIHHASERAILSFDEELARGRAVERNVPTTIRFGIGGAGNCIEGLRPSSISSEGLTYSNEPLPYGALDALRRRWSRIWSRRSSVVELDRE